MNKHSMAIAFAMIGVGVCGFISDFSIGGMVCGVCLGAFVGYFVFGLTHANGTILQQKFIALGDLKGKTLDEIKADVGEPTTTQSCTVADTGNPGTLVTWAQNPYLITLLFDENNVCLGVNKEIINN